MRRASVRHLEYFELLLNLSEKGNLAYHEHFPALRKHRRIKKLTLKKHKKGPSMFVVGRDPHHEVKVMFCKFNRDENIASFIDMNLTVEVVLIFS